jgi:hypothetical protein
VAAGKKFIANAVEPVVKLLQVIPKMRGTKVLETAVLYLGFLVIGTPVDNHYLSHAQTKGKRGAANCVAITGESAPENKWQEIEKWIEVLQIENFFNRAARRIP